MNASRIFRVGLIALVALVALAAVTGFFIVRSSAFHRYILATIINRAGKSTGGRVEIGDYAIHWSSLHADFYRVVLHGTEAAPNAPLFSADHLGLGLKLVSVWKREVDLQEIVADHPVVHLWVDAQGRTNLPQAPEPAQPINIFDMAIAHAVIHQGEIYYNDREIPLDAEVLDLHAQVTKETLKTAYDGMLSYSKGRVQIGAFNPLQHGLEAKFKAGPSGLTLTSVIVTSGSSRLSTAGRVQDYSKPSVEGSYEGTLSGAELASLLKNNALPTGEITIKGSVQYQGISGRLFLDGLSIQGQISSPALAIDLPEARATVRSFSAEYRLNQNSLEAKNLRGEVSGGHADGALTVRDLTGKREARFEGSVREISLAAANSAWTQKPLERAAVNGRLDGTIQASWHGSMQDLQIRSDATIVASTPVVRETSTDSSVIPINGAVHLAYNGTTNIMTLERTYLRTPHISVNLDGTMGKQSSVRIKAQSDDLREVDLLMIPFRGSAGTKTKPAHKSSELLGLGGSASFNGQLQGTTKEPHLAGEISGENIQYQGTTLPNVRAQLDAGPTGIALHQGQLQTSSQGNAQFDFTAGLRDWSYGPQNPITVKVVASNMPVADLQHYANLHYPVSGILSGNVSIQGSQTNPVGLGTVRLSGGSAWDQPIQDLSLQFDGDGSAIHVTANVLTSAGSGSAKVTYNPRDEGYDAQVDFPRLQLEQLQAVRSRNLEVAGFVTVSAKGRGTWKAPQLEATIEVPSLQFRQQSFDGLKAHATVTAQQASFTLDSRVSGVNVQARGTVNLNSDYDATASFDTPTIELGPLIGSYLHGRAADVSGQTEVHGSLRGPLKFPERLDAHIDIPRLSMSYQSIQLASVAPLRIDYRNGTLTLDRAELKGTGTDLQLQGYVPISGNGTLRATATGTMDLHIVRLLNPDIESSGQVKLDISAQGAYSRPDIRGAVHIIDGAFQMPDAPLGAEKVNAEFEFQNGRVNIKSFTAQTGGGTVTAQGFATYQPAPQYNVVLEARGVRVRYPEGVRMVLASNLILNGTGDSSVLSGQVMINRVSFTESFDIATFAQQFTGPSSPPREGIAQKVKLNVTLKSTSEMELSSAQLSVAGSADLQVRGTLAEPILTGRTNITSGEFYFNGRRYEVQSGVIQFPGRADPVVNLVVTTTVNQFSLNVRLNGPLDRIRTTYTSDPPLPPVDVIDLLITGHTTEAPSAGTITPQSVLAGQMAKQVGGRVAKLTGVSSLTIDPQIGGNGSNPGARLALQQRVTKNLFFTFATDVNSTQGELVQIEYQITRKYSVSALRDQNGSYSVQMKVRKKF